MMMQNHKCDILRRHREDIAKCIQDIKSVVSKLKDYKIISQNMEEEIMAKPTTIQRCRELLIILPRRGDRSFEIFYKVLIEYDEIDAANYLKGKGGIRTERKLPAEFPDPDDDSTIVNVQKCMSVNGDDIYDKYKGCVNGQCDEVYQMSALKRGYCVVINNETFTKLAYRQGSNKDVESLKKLFKQLSFLFEDYKDKTAQEIRDIVKDYQQRDHSQYNCFVLVILSHGSHGNIFGVDGVEVKISELVFSFDSEGCKSLSGKPKLFFIQACQGPLYDRGTKCSLTEDEKKEIEDITKKIDELHLHQPVEKTDASIANATRNADFFIAMATSPGFVSWRNIEIGTWFIQAVVYVFKYWAHSHELDKLMTKVNRLVQSAATQVERHKQCPECRSTLGKSLYFFPGLPPEQLTPPLFHQHGSQQQPMDQTQNSEIIPNPTNM